MTFFSIIILGLEILFGLVMLTIVIFAVVWLYFEWKRKKLIQNIPIKVIEEVKHERTNQESRRQEASDWYGEELRAGELRPKEKFTGHESADKRTPESSDIESTSSSNAEARDIPNESPSIVGGAEQDIVGDSNNTESSLPRRRVRKQRGKVE